MAARPVGLRALGSVTTTVLCVATYWVVRLAYADHLAAGEAPGQAAHAVRLAPANSRYWLRWADLSAQAGEPARRAIEHALAASPRDADNWIRAGLSAEADRDYARAEQCLRHAARLSRLYEPRWTLANYYFRRGNAAEFWLWMRGALEWAYGDRQPLYQLAWQMTQDAGTILEAVPPNAPSLAAYLGFLLSSNRLAAARDVAARLAPLASSDSRFGLLAYINVAIGAHQPGSALEIWNQLCSRRLLPYRPLDPARGLLLTNGDFASPPLEAGFDWRLTASSGVAAVRNERPPLLRFSFSGSQPESCRLLAQLVPAVPATAYRLRFEYQTTGIAPASGLRWRIFDAAGEGELATEARQLSSDGWTAEIATFRTPAGTAWFWLTLDYQRMPGTTRIEGSLWLRNVSLGEIR